MINVFRYYKKSILDKKKLMYSKNMHLTVCLIYPKGLMKELFLSEEIIEIVR